ncbi:MAG TPA: NAD(P)-dependent oxidoreductase [Vicinamibacterales bacterium]|nr:NAD(P)-dependent oxidoreductase [Vicinamibacterales bacterium]
MRVGVIGLGVMGTPMARNLLKSGHEVTVFARRADAMAPLAAAGARTSASPAEAAAVSDVTITMVLDTRAVESVVLGPGGIIEGARSGSIVVDHSTIEPEGARKVAATLQSRGIEMLDAPVSGGAAVAEAGTLSIMVGGTEAALERVRPILACYGKTIVHIGPSGAGQVAKACNQICTIVNTLGAAEAMLLAERAGVDPAKVKDVLMTGFGASRMLEVQAPKMIARNFEAKVESRLHHKDIQIVLDMARALGLDLPGSAAAARVIAALQARGGATRDTAAVFEVLDNP